MTFSIAARCPRTGLMGAAVTTSSIAVGSRCVFARGGAGVVLTQHRTDPRLGPLGLDFLSAGSSASQAIESLVASTPHHAWRQLAVVDRHGGVAYSHGAALKPIFAAAEGPGVIAVGNILANPSVCAAEVDAFLASPDQHIAARLLAALEAGLRAGGEIRPLRSAALLVVGEESFPLVDLRVDDDPEPLETLRALWSAYQPKMDLFIQWAKDPASAGPASSSGPAPNAPSR